MLSRVTVVTGYYPGYYEGATGAGDLMPVRDVVVPAAKEGPPGKLPAVVYPPPPPSSSSTSGADASAGTLATVEPPFEYSEHTDYKGQSNAVSVVINAVDLSHKKHPIFA